MFPAPFSPGAVRPFAGFRKSLFVDVPFAELSNTWGCGPALAAKEPRDARWEGVHVGDSARWVVSQRTDPMM